MFALCMIILSAESQAKKRGCSIDHSWRPLCAYTLLLPQLNKSFFSVGMPTRLTFISVAVLICLFFFSTNVSVTLIT